MNFSDISLNLVEYITLCKSRYLPVKCKNARRLLRHELVSEIVDANSNPGYMPKTTGKAEISDRGIDYLSYLKRERIKLFWIPFTVALLTSVLANWLIRWLEGQLQSGTAIP